MKTKQRLPHHRRNHESDRNSEANRRVGQGSYTQRDTEDAAYTGGRPAADSIDTVGTILLLNGRSGQASGGGVVHSDEMVTLNHENPGGVE